MSKTELLIKLRELHEELSSINDDLKSVDLVDDETIDALGDLVSEAGQIVDRTKETSDPHESLAEHHDLMDRIMEFENAHPRVTRFLSQLTDMLAMLGI